jgi:uncharacterized protein with PIN domain
VTKAVSFYTDEHVAKAVARGLRLRGIDSVTAAEASMLGQADEEHLRRALDMRRVMVTMDEDFLALHAAGSIHAGIAYAPQGTSIGEFIRSLMLIHQVLDANEMHGRLEYL